MEETVRDESEIHMIPYLLYTEAVWTLSDIAVVDMEAFPFPVFDRDCDS